MNVLWNIHICHFYYSYHDGKVGQNEKEGNDGYNNYSRVDLSKSFAQLSLPPPLVLQERGGKKALGVIAKTPIKALTQFGPLQGEQIMLKDIADDFEMKELWQVNSELNWFACGLESKSINLEIDIYW